MNSKFKRYVEKTQPSSPRSLEKLNLQSRTIFCHDNLPVLRGINSNSMDLIYLDHSFNKGRNFHALPLVQPQKGQISGTYGRQTKLRTSGIIR